MAQQAPQEPAGRRRLFVVKSYTYDRADIIGRGQFGIVYRGYHSSVRWRGVRRVDTTRRRGGAGSLR